MTCIINNGSVYNNDFQWKVCYYSKKIVCSWWYHNEGIELQNIPPKGYFFKDFGEILQGKCKIDRLEGSLNSIITYITYIFANTFNNEPYFNVDIIGVVSEINHIQSNTPGKKVVVSVVLKDLK